MDEPDENTTGFNLETQKLHCLVVLDDTVGAALSSKAGDAFWRGFVTEDRRTGEVTARFRYRYKDGDQWYALRPKADGKTIKEQVEHIVKGFEKTLRTAASMMTGGIPVPDRIVTSYYPPDPEDSQKTLEWLIAQDLMEIRTFTKDGREIPVAKGTDTVT